MNKNEKNNVILGQNNSLEPMTSAESRNCHPRACNARTETRSLRRSAKGKLSRIKKGKALSLRGAVGDVAISCDKALSSRGRAESSDVVISCDKVLMNKKNPEKTKTVIPDLIGYLSRIFNLIRRSPEFFRILRKNRDDSLLFSASPRTRFSEIATSALRLLAMTIPTLILAAVLSMGIASESRADVDGSGDPIINAPTSGTCGNGCNWSYNTSTKELTLSGNGTMDNYSWSGNDKPWQSYLTTIETVKVANGSTLSNIGDNAFSGATSLLSADMPNVTRIGESAFASASNLTSVYMPGVEQIGPGGFNGATSLTSVDLPSIKGIGSGGFQGTSMDYLGLPEHEVTIYSLPNNLSNCSSGNRSACGSCDSNSGKYLASGRGCVTADTCEILPHYEWDASTNSCNRIQTAVNDVNPDSCYANGQVFWDNACVDEYPFAKKHWTPAEAAQYLKDTDNEIIMTFKVNR